MNKTTTEETGKLQMASLRESLRRCPSTEPPTLPSMGVWVIYRYAPVWKTV
jgi:hypothetical protein